MADAVSAPPGMRAAGTEGMKPGDERRCWPSSTRGSCSTGERLVLTSHYHLVLERRSKGYCFCSDPRTARRTLSAGTRGYTTAALAVGPHAWQREVRPRIGREAYAGPCGPPGGRPPPKRDVAATVAWADLVSRGPEKRPPPSAVRSRREFHRLPAFGRFHRRRCRARIPATALSAVRPAAPGALRGHTLR